MFYVYAIKHTPYKPTGPDGYTLVGEYETLEDFTSVMIRSKTHDYVYTTEESFKFRNENDMVNVYLLEMCDDFYKSREYDSSWGCDYYDDSVDPLYLTYKKRVCELCK